MIVLRVQGLFPRKFWESEERLASEFDGCRLKNLSLSENVDAEGGGGAL